MKEIKTEWHNNKEWLESSENAYFKQKVKEIEKEGLTIKQKQEALYKK